MKHDIDTKIGTFSGQLRSFGTNLQNDIALLKRAAATKPCADGTTCMLLYDTFDRQHPSQ